MDYEWLSRLKEPHDTWQLSEEKRLSVLKHIETYLLESRHKKEISELEKRQEQEREDLAKRFDLLDEQFSNQGYLAEYNKT